MGQLAVVSALLGVLGTVCAIVFSYAAFSRERKKDESEEGKQDGTLLTEIGYIKSGVDDIKRKQEKQDEQYIDVIIRVTAADSSLKQAHKRIDRLEDSEKE